MSNPETDIQVADPSAPTRQDYDFNLTEPNKLSVPNILALAKLAARGGMTDPKGAEGLAIRAVFAITVGFSPIEGMQGLYLIEGKPVFGAQLLAKRVRQSDIYDYKVVEQDATKCSLLPRRKFDGQWEELPVVTYTIEEATKAGLTNKDVWKRYPANMLFARAMANMHRFHMPDLIGMPFYTEGEDPEPANPEPSVAETAAKTAMERATKGRKKAEEPPKEPESNVIEAEFSPVEEVAKDDQVHVQMSVSEASEEPETTVATEPEAEAPTVAQMAEHPASAGQWDPLDDTAPQNRFAVIEGWGEPDPIDGLTPDLGVVGYHHFIKRRDDGKFWAVFDRESGTQLERIQVSAGSDDNFNHLIGAMTSADQAFRYSDAVLNKACAEKNANGNPSNKANVCLAVKTIRVAKKSAPAETVPTIDAATTDSEAILIGEIGDEPVAVFRSQSEAKGKDVGEFFTIALEFLAEPARAGKGKDNIPALNMRFMQWKNEK